MESLSLAPGVVQDKAQDNLTEIQNMHTGVMEAVITGQAWPLESKHRMTGKDKQLVSCQEGGASEAP